MMKRMIYCCLAAAFMALSGVAAPTITVLAASGLVHRWSFNGSLADSVGGQTATAVGSVSSNGTSYSLSGGKRGTSYISLGSSVLPRNTGAATLEIWGTQHAVKQWSRVFDFGQDSQRYLMWAWNHDTYAYDAVSYNDYENHETSSDSELGKEYCFVVTIKNSGYDAFVRCTRYDAQTARAVGNCSFTMESYNLMNMEQSNCWLGHSQWDGDEDASASYNEVRVWNRVLSDAEIIGHIAAGPDVFWDSTPTISDVTAQQRYPWNGKMDISYTVSGDIASHCKNYGLIPALKVTATDKVANKTYTATKLSGDTALTDGTHKLIWDLDAEGVSIKSDNVVFNVACETTATGGTTEMAEAKYCVIDLSAGWNATSYPVTYLATEPQGGFNVDEYKTTKLVLKRIEAGSFIMGEDQTDQSHKVTLTKPFFMGLFEVTQKQWSLVKGMNPSSEFGVGDAYPVYYVSYNMIRGSTEGAKWPTSSAVDASSFLGKLQARTGINFDLPTEAQWEYACRAGTTTTYYWGSSMNGDYAWYWPISDTGTRPVGGKKPNAWGLYDMSGNVWEWNLDWIGTLSYGTDPKGSSSGSERVFRGGCCDNDESGCTSSSRDSYIPSIRDDGIYGFRLSMTLP